jgi:hypothetical protein
MFESGESIIKQNAHIHLLFFRGEKFSSYPARRQPDVRELCGLLNGLQ